MALTNTAGEHVQVVLSAPFAVGTGTDAEHPLQEAAYYGNLFVSPPQAYYAEGSAFQGAAVGKTVVGGIANRSCASWRDSTVSCPYVNTGTIAPSPTDSAQEVSARCSMTADGTATVCSSGSGAQRTAWNNPITTYREVGAYASFRQQATAIWGSTDAPLVVGTAVSLLPQALPPGWFVRHWAFEAHLDPLSTPLDRLDATFFVRGGLAEPSGVSFESANYPGYYLKHEAGKLVLRQFTAGTGFAADATFLPIVGLAGQHTSLALYANPLLFVHLTGTSSGSPLALDPFDGTDAFRKAASFAVGPGVAQSVASLYTARENVARSASLTSSFVSSWERLEAVNDGFEPKSSSDHSHGAYGNWDGDAAYGRTNWLAFSWAEQKAITGVDAYWWNDGAGIDTPSSAPLEYLDGDGVWRPFGEIGTVLHDYNRVVVSPPVVTRAVRLSMVGSKATGLLEAKVWGTSSS